MSTLHNGIMLHGSCCPGASSHTTPCISLDSVAHHCRTPQPARGAGPAATCASATSAWGSQISSTPQPVSIAQFLTDGLSLLQANVDPPKLTQGPECMAQVEAEMVRQGRSHLLWYTTSQMAPLVKTKRAGNDVGEAPNTGVHR